MMRPLIARIVTPQRIDQAAIAASGICVVHCLVGPLVIVLAPVLATFGVADDTFHRLLLWLVVPTSVGGLALGCRRHRDPWVIVRGVLGVSALGFALAGGHAVLGEIGERIVTMTGGLVVASAHVRNFRLCLGDRCHVA